MTATITTTTGAQYARVMGVGSARGSRVVDNAEMCTMIESSDEWIQQRTGIIERRWVAEGEDIETLALSAATKALHNSGLTATDIDAILVASVSYTRQTPSLACVLAGRLGCGDIAAFDMQAACAGFNYMISVADSMVRTGSAHHVLLISADVMTAITNFEDRGTAFLFADGAGAVVVGPSGEAAIGPVVWGSIGSEAEVIAMPTWEQAIAEHTTPKVIMAGNKVYKWATTAIIQKASEAIQAAGITPTDLDVLIPHQANNRITDAIVRRLRLPDSIKVCREIVTMGNTSSASIPLGMDAMLTSGEARSGDLALIIGFGAGLVYAGQVVRLP